MRLFNASLCGVLLAVHQVGHVVAQTIGFTIYPQQVVTGLSYTVAWNSNAQPVTVQLLRNGRREGSLFTSDGTTSTFQWRVQDDYNGGTDYTLQLTSGSTVVTAPVSVIEDEDGLVVSGSTILTPSPTTLVTSATAISSVGVTNLGTTATSTSQTSASQTSSNLAQTPTPSTSATSGVNTGRSLSAGAIAGIVIGAIAIVALIVLGIVLRRRRRSSRTPTDPDPIASFLALGKRGGPTRRTVKGTSPEVIKDDKMVVTREHDDGYEDELLPNQAELHGESHIPWNELEEGPDPSIFNGVFEIDGRSIGHKLPTGEMRQR